MKPVIDKKIARCKERRRERRAAKQVNKQRPRFVEAVGADEAGIRCDGTAGWRKPLSGQHSDGESQ